ncbi:MAG: hypothetical protein HY805_05760 [Nitrospirae bacterium]|nr:hypothetical protein [Nitrospirota bacterium]
MKGIRIICLAMAFLISTSITYAQIEAGRPSYVNVKDDLLSVELLDAEFGVVMEEIAQKAGFKTDINRAVYIMRLSTSFNDLDIHKGIVRLLTLISQKNYSIYYDEKGRISKIEVRAGGEAGPKKQTVIPAKQLPSQFPVERPIISPPLIRELTPEEQEAVQEMMDEPYPYIPPKEPPVYIPKKKE